jgi:carboxypeptidase T
MLQLLPLLLAATIQDAPTSPLPTAAAQSSETRPLARIELDLDAPGAPTLQTLQELALDLIEFDLEQRRAVALAPPADLARLEAAGIPYALVRADEGAFYAERLAGGLLPTAANLGAWLSPPFAQGGMGGYYTLAQVESVLDQIAASYPALVTPKFSIGQSIEGRDIWALKVSDNPGVDENEPEVRFDSLHHAREPQGMQTTLWFLLWCLESYGADPLATYLVDERELYFVPVVNPDGYRYNQQIAPGGGGLWRKNRRNNGGGSFGVDLNRNYPYQWGYDNIGSSGSSSSETYRGPSPASEPETQAMVAFIQARDFRSSISAHTYSNLWLQPYGYDFVFPSNQQQYNLLNDLCTEVNGYAAGSPPEILYSANGGTIDYEANLTGALTWTPEIGSSSDGFWPPSSRIVPLAEENLLAYQRVALAGGAFVYLADLTSTAIGDGDEFAEGGESFELALTVNNVGGGATVGPVTATLVIEGGPATVTAGQTNFGPLPSFTSAGNASAPLSFTIDAGAPAGSTVLWRLTLDHDGYSQDVTGSVPIGEPRLLIADDAELARGWITGLPSDTTSTGIWERGVPIGTNSSGQPAAPGSDTSQPGQFAYVTGNGGGSAGNDDVDNGLTTLISPRFDLSGAESVVVRYQRWFADLTVADDVFAVDVSNDDGQSWVPLERITQNQNQWAPFEADLGQVLPLSAEMRLRFIAEDDPNNSVVEAAVDDLEFETFGDGTLIALYGTPTVGGAPRLFTSVEAPSTVSLLMSAGTFDLALPGIEGKLLVDPATAVVLTTQSAAPGAPLEQVLAVPNSSNLGGATVYLQAAAFGASGVSLSNRVTFAIN